MRETGIRTQGIEDRFPLQHGQFPGPLLECFLEPFEGTVAVLQADVDEPPSGTATVPAARQAAGDRRGSSAPRPCRPARAKA